MPENKSEIADPKFFLAKDGRVNAKGELEATINALYNEERLDDNSTACLYPARKHWLQKELGLKDLPTVECYDFDLLMDMLKPNSATLVFPFMQGSAPSSMFGHTFLRIDGKDRPIMLSYAFNYASESDDSDNQLLYMYKGFFGGYKGTYSLLPYYEKIREYRDLEERDIWEYELNFTEEETQQMVRHMWEIEQAYSWYYFFTKNCSYKMFWIMESGREGLNLRKYFAFHVIPSESIRATLDEGLVLKKNYRPARSSKLEAYSKELSSSDIDDVFKIALAELEPQVYLQKRDKTQQMQRYVLEASSEFVEYDYLKKDINESVYKQRLHKILSARAGLGKGDSIQIPTPVDPMLSHRSFRTSVKAGMRNSEPIGFIGVRPANHDINDFAVGLLPGTQIEFMDLLFSYTQDELELEKATIVSAVAFTPRTEFFQPSSWRFSVGFDREFLGESTDFRANYATGATWGNGDNYFYLLADFIAYIETDVYVGIGVVGGAVLHQGVNFKTNLETSQRVFSNRETQLLFSAKEHYRSSQNTALSISYEYIQKRERDFNTYTLSFDYFF
ncbi:DUF4105 domain-containing protein [Sulfurimonas sp. SAG-AH-194-C21]|nr:DUF4105 domain-containing protein [Sulfurimonas sp. SAG-AH-194-C21]MDF1883324.1 DUF4105 domain-containing protein [Sulfurimonas sp. SAG-AH-194-C21]